MKSPTHSPTLLLQASDNVFWRGASAVLRFKSLANALRFKIHQWAALSNPTEVNCIHLALLSICPGFKGQTKLRPPDARRPVRWQPAVSAAQHRQSSYENWY
eukprot:scaffold19523_cov35-Prasinocladus_malaysianus.AAC.1